MCFFVQLVYGIGLSRGQGNNFFNKNYGRWNRSSLVLFQSNIHTFFVCLILNFYILVPILTYWFMLESGSEDLK